MPNINTTTSGLKLPQYNAKVSKYLTSSGSSKAQENMPPYRYSPLPEVGKIRLLRLVPHENETAPIECRIFEFDLNKRNGGTHLYDALSYVWGASEKPKKIILNDLELGVTNNLYAALLHLRDRHFERILWIDAICIDQENLTERGHQIKSMARIYGMANRVVVWLGESGDQSDEVIEELREAADEEMTRNPRNEQAILSLLKRPWFKRIWVLQEAAAARNILMKCGTAEIDGYAFCLGIKSLKLKFQGCSDLESLIRSVTFLIRGAHFRTKDGRWWEGRTSLEIGTLGQLIDMYHSHDATERHDKIFALLGMSSGDLAGAGIVPDYQIPWTELQEKILHFIIGHQLSCRIHPQEAMFLIECDIGVLGRVVLVESEHAWYRSKVYILYNSAAISIDGRSSTSDQQHQDIDYHTCWVLPAAAKHIAVGDIVCVLNKSKVPTIVRASGEILSIVAVTATPILESDSHKPNTKWQERFDATKLATRHVVLLWNWADPIDSTSEWLQSYIDDEASRSIQSDHKTHVAPLARADRWLKVTEVISDSGDADHSNRVLNDALAFLIYPKLKGDSLSLLLITERCGWIHERNGRLMKAINSFESAMEMSVALQGYEHPSTLRSILILSSLYRIQSREKTLAEDGRAGGLTFYQRSLRNKAGVLQIMANIMKQKDCDLSVLKSSFYLSNHHSCQGGSDDGYDDDHSSYLFDETWGFLAQPFYAKAFATLPLTCELVDLCFSRKYMQGLVFHLLRRQCYSTILGVNKIARVTAEYYGADVMKLLILDKGKTELFIDEHLFEAASRNRRTVEVLLLLFQQRPNQLVQSRFLEAAARTSQVNMDVLLDKIERPGLRNSSGYGFGSSFILKGLDQITERVLEIAAEYRGITMMKRLFNLLNAQHRNGAIHITSNVIKAAAKRRDHHVLKYLLSVSHPETKITDDIWEKAVQTPGAEIYWPGSALWFLLDTGGYKIESQIIERLVQLAITSGCSGNLALLLDHPGHDLAVNEQMIAVASKAENGEHVLEVLLNRKEKVMW